MNNYVQNICFLIWKDQSLENIDGVELLNKIPD